MMRRACERRTRVLWSHLRIENVLRTTTRKGPGFARHIPGIQDGFDAPLQYLSSHVLKVGRRLYCKLSSQGHIVLLLLASILYKK